MSESFAAGLVGVVLDERYRLDAVLGEGGMGAVYRAHHLAMDRKVAVKLLKPHLTSDETALQRFAREARSTMKVESDHAVKVLDFGITPHKDYYMVLEYLDGRTVQRELDVDGPFAPARAVHIARQSLLALGAAHSKGLVHRDIKPENILLMRQGDDPDFAKVLDFGVAKLMEGAEGSNLAITQAGMVFGTPEFMSPEQACGQSLDGRSDLYSLAATLFAMLTGCGMYRANVPIEWLMHHARTPPPHLADGLAVLAPYTALDKMLQRCLAKRREDRPRDANEMIAMLDAITPSLGTGATPIADASATLLPEAQNAAAQALARISHQSETPVQRRLPRDGATAESSSALPRYSDAVSAYTPSISSDTLGPTTTGAVPVGGRRATWLVLGGAAVVAMIAIAIVVSTRKKSGRDGTVVAKGSDRAVVADAEPQAVSATDATPADAGAPAVTDAAIGLGIDAGLRKGAPANPAVAAHLAAAEEAKRAGNHLRQLAEADAALQADPRNVRAHLLFADALIASGDLDRGCKHLRDLGRNPTARARARQAGCPTN